MRAAQSESPDEIAQIVGRGCERTAGDSQLTLMDHERVHASEREPAEAHAHREHQRSGE